MYCLSPFIIMYSKTRLKWPLKKKTKNGFQYRLSLNAGQKYCRMLQGEHSAILWTFIKLPFVIKIFILSFSEWLLKTGFTVITCMLSKVYNDEYFNSYTCVCNDCNRLLTTNQ